MAMGRGASPIEAKKCWKPQEKVGRNFIDKPNVMTKGEFPSSYAAPHLRLWVHLPCSSGPAYHSSFARLPQILARQTFLPHAERRANARQDLMRTLISETFRPKAEHACDPHFMCHGVPGAICQALHA